MGADGAFTSLVWPLGKEDPDDAFSSVPYEKVLQLITFHERFWCIKSTTLISLQVVIIPSDFNANANTPPNFPCFAGILSSLLLREFNGVTALWRVREGVH